MTRRRELRTSGDMMVEWVAVEDAERDGSGSSAYELALDPYAEPRPALICRNASGRVLKKVPAQVRRHERAESLLALADWLADHAAHARAEAERWMTRSLPVPARLMRAVWPDPYWRRALHHLVIAPYGPDGSADVSRAGLLVDAGPGAADGLRVVSPEGEVSLDVPLVTVPHPVLLAPDGSEGLERWRLLLDAYGGEQGVEQLRRTVWRRPSAAPVRRHSRWGVSAFDGAEFDSGARFERAVSRFGGRIRGETAHFDVPAGRARFPMRIDLRWQGPMSGTLMNELFWGPRHQLREGPGAFDDIPLVAWSEGMRVAAYLYDARDGGYRQEERPDASAAYRLFLARCAENAGPRDASRAPEGARPGGVGETASEGWSEEELLDAGAVAPGKPSGADGEDALTVCRYDWAALDEGARIVRLTPGRAADAEDIVARALGLTPVTDAGPGREVVGRVRPMPPAFLARVSRAEPSDVHRAIGLLGQLRTCATTAATKAGRAAKSLEASVAPLEKEAPRLAATVLEEGSRIIAAAGSPAMAQPLFARARDVENSSGLAVDEDAVIESFVECAAEGAVSTRALAAHRDALTARLPAPQAAHSYRRLVLAWHRADLPSRPEFAGALLAFTSGATPLDEEHRQLLRGLLTYGGMDDATTSVSAGWTPVLLALLAEGQVTPEALLRLTAAPVGGGRAALTEAAAAWVGLLRETGAAALLTGVTPASAPGSPKAAGGSCVDAEAVLAWLDRFAHRYRGLRPSAAGVSELLGEIGARLRAEGAVHHALPMLRMPDSHASARDRCVDLGLLDMLLTAGIPIDPDESSPLGFLGWLGRAKGDDLPHSPRTAASRPDWWGTCRMSDPRATLLIGRLAPHPLAGDTGRLKSLATGPALRAFVAEVLGEHGRRAQEGGVQPLHAALRDLEPFAARAVRRHFTDEAERILAPDPASALARTLRTGIPDELGLPDEDAGWQRGLWTEIRDGGDALLLAGVGRAIAMRPEGVVAQWQDEAYDHRRPWQTGVLWRDGAFEPLPFDGKRRVHSTPEPAERESVLMPGDDRARTVHRVTGATGEYGELRAPDGAIVAAWPLTGQTVSSPRTARWAAGSSITPPPGWWHALRPRDAAGSARLRAVDTATAEGMLAAVGPDTRSCVDLLAESRSGSRGLHEATLRLWDELGETVRRMLPELTDDRLVDGVTGALWSAVECEQLRARIGAA